MTKRNAKRSNVVELEVGQSENRRSFKNYALEARNPEQKKFINTIKNFSVTVGIGAAGTGKTMIAAVLAAQALEAGTYDHIVLIRPNEPLGKSIGALPGDHLAKLEPYIAPFRDGLERVISKGYLKYLLNPDNTGAIWIEVVGVEFLRGRTFNNAFILVDEAQNLSVEAMKCLLTRFGEGSKMVITGDIDQMDIKGESGLQLLLDINDSYERKPMAVVTLETCERSAEAAFFLEATKSR